MLREQLDSPQIVEEQHQRRDNYHQEQEEQHILDVGYGTVLNNFRILFT